MLRELIKHIEFPCSSPRTETQGLAEEQDGGDEEDEEEEEEEEEEEAIMRLWLASTGQDT